MSEKTLHIEGTVENIVFRSEATGYTVIDLDAGGELITVVGDLGDTDVGESLILEGSYITHKKFGTQFQAVYCERKLHSTVVNIEKYLASGAIRGIGPGLAKKIVNVFGDQTLSVIENDPYRLSQVKGISPKMCEAIAAEAKKLFSLRIIMSFLSQYDVKSQFAMNAFRQYGADAITLLKANPYILCGDAIGLDFRKADEIAHDMHIEKNSDKRIIAGMQYILRENAIRSGHTCLPVDSLLELSKNALEITERDFFSSLNAAIDDHEHFDYMKNDRE